MNFPCTICGCCCKRIGKTIEAIKLESWYSDELKFPYKWDETGRCEKLTDDNRCSVYENRPKLCSISKLADVSKMEKKQYYLEVAKACNEIMDEDGVPLELRIEIV